VAMAQLVKEKSTLRMDFPSTLRLSGDSVAVQRKHNLAHKIGCAPPEREEIPQNFRRAKNPLDFCALSRNLATFLAVFANWRRAPLPLHFRKVNNYFESKVLNISLFSAAKHAPA